MEAYGLEHMTVRSLLHPYEPAVLTVTVIIKVLILVIQVPIGISFRISLFV